MTVDDRFSAAWADAQSPPDLGLYLSDAADAVQITTLVELVRVDIRERKLRGGLTKSLDDYCDEYPELRSVLLESPSLTRQLDDEATADPDDDRTALAHGTVTSYGPPMLDPLDHVDAGQRIDDFDLVAPIGVGAFARVFLARQRSMQRLVAVKISEDYGAEPQTLAQLDHDYIVRVYDQRLVPERNLRLLYMQFLPGGTLLGVLQKARKVTWTPDRSGQLLLDAIDDSMEARGAARPSGSSVRAELAELSWPETVAWLGRRLADALDYAARRGVLHRDIKPANILLTADGVPKLADFNTSFVVGADPMADFGGSLSYMSPEQLDACHPETPGTAAQLDARSDIYSLGVVLWELLAGRKPFPSDVAQAGDIDALDAMLASRRAGVGADALADLPPDTPAALRRVLLACLHPDKDKRWANGRELATQFDLCLDAHARDLVDPPATSWRPRLRGWLVAFVVAGVGIPNAIASLYLIQQNRALVLTKLSPEATTTMINVSPPINVIAFAIGGIAMAYMCRRLLSMPRRLRRGETYDAVTMAHARTDALFMGVRIVAICFALWIVAGLAWQTALYFTGSVPTVVELHFIAGQVICAAIAIAYPYFLMTFYAVRCIYPVFLPFGRTSSADARQLRSLSRLSNFFLAVAASVPLLGVARVAFIGAEQIPLVLVSLRILCVGGIVAFVFTYWLFRLLEQDLRALERVVSQD
ncbi:serine/threonine-protein kinase [Antrihabitans cavernicola]|uniref:Serine/threonine protein kinase n=1 Tax=Antrihabitans cavernicola TaxID=2495913 RepID=A0A5A7SI45_9NOCA|nr:serine/threonine-protein kinase [Spelaeibacter cavernicola]KAA0024397.1 serine/threonine protein kinase [Spelaeibacter cavernicola]